MIIFSDTYIWKEKHYGYHLTHVNNIPFIEQDGLKCLCKERSQKVGDFEKAIYFFDSLTATIDWAMMLYPSVSLQDLILLRFNLQGFTCYLRDISIGDFYIKENVLKESLFYLKILKGKRQVSLDCIENACCFSNEYKLLWKKIGQYPE